MILRALALIAAAATLTSLASTRGLAQSVPSPTAKPKPQPDLFQTPSSAKTGPVKPTKSCSTYGDGFVYVPGTDTCVKSGGYVRVDGGVGGR